MLHLLLTRIGGVSNVLVTERERASLRMKRMRKTFALVFFNKEIITIQDQKNKISKVDEIRL